jgi:putative phosphoesterase
MKIGVVSDTHSHDIPSQVIQDLKTVDLIIHAGDFCDESDMRQFSRLGNLKAVHGNMDSEDLRKKLPRKQIFQCEDVAIGLFHGEGPPKRLLEVVKREFAGDTVDMIIFGHSHQPMNETIDGILFFNPGSPNDICTAPCCSYGMIEINKRRIKAKIIKVKA